MIPMPSGMRVWIAAGHTDMRRGMQGLALRFRSIFGDSVVATALLDRLLHHAVVIQIEGSSYRLREHADLLPETVRFKPNAANPIPPTLNRRGRPPKNGGADHPHG
jgi:hypothetical protein